MKEHDKMRNAFYISRLDDIQTEYKKRHNAAEREEEIQAFIEFLKGTLSICPRRRWSAEDALHHPFVTKEKFVKGSFPKMVEEKRKINFMTLSGHQMGQEMKTQLSLNLPGGMGFSMRTSEGGNSMRFPNNHGPINLDPRFNQGVLPNNNINNTFVRPNFIAPQGNKTIVSQEGLTPFLDWKKNLSNCNLPKVSEDSSFKGKKKDFRLRSNSDAAEEKLRRLKSDQSTSLITEEKLLEKEEFELHFEDN